MPTIHEIQFFLKNLLDTDSIKDYAINGIQVENEFDINKIIFAVDISKELIIKTINLKSNLIIVHHGLFWGNILPLTGIYKEKIKMLLANNIGLIAYHLPLDRHVEIGNNAQILKKIGGLNLLPFGFDKGIHYGYITELNEKINIDNILNKLNLKSNYNYLDFGNKEIKKIAVVSGSGARFFDEALLNKASLYITGDSEHILYHAAKENKINVLFAGHYFTETFGIKALQQVIDKEFKIQTEFIDLQTGL